MTTPVRSLLVAHHSLPSSLHVHRFSLLLHVYFARLYSLRFTPAFLFVFPPSLVALLPIIGLLSVQSIPLN